MLKTNKVFLLSVIVLAAGFVFLLSKTKPAQANSGIPDTPDTRQIMAVIDRAYQIMTHASRTFDVSEFPSVFIDTEDYKLKDQQKQAVAYIFGADIANAENTGYLTAMQAQYISMGQGAELLRVALDKAKAENRNLTTDEFQEVVISNHGQMPASGVTIDIKTNLVFQSIDITVDRAIVRYDDGAALQDAILVRKAGQWLIASIIPIWIHF